jgi:Matrixin
MGRRVFRAIGALLALGLTVTMFVFVAYAIPHLEELKSEVRRLGDQPSQSRLDQALDGAIGFAEEQAQAPAATGDGKGYRLNSPAPEGSGLAAGHWCAATPIGYRIDFTAAGMAGSTRARERLRWREAFAAWSRASGGRYRFSYRGPATFPVSQDAADGYPIDPQLLHDGEIAITYAVGSDQGVRWRDYVHTRMSEALGVGGVEPVGWRAGPQRGLMTHGMVVLDALDAANDPHAVPTPYVHELGHALGLGHVDDPGQMMYTHAVSNAMINAGDRRGIQHLAGLPCG